MVTTDKFVTGSVLFIRDLLKNNLTDPITATRKPGEKFVMTSYPERAVTYPIQTVRNVGPSTSRRLGARSSLYWVNIRLEIRSWAKNEKQKDGFTEDIFNILRANQFTGSGTEFEGLHDFELISSVPVDELGAAGIKSQVSEIDFKFVLGS